MPKVKVFFEKILQDTQDYNNFQQQGNHMVSRIYFSMEISGNRHEGLVVEVRQPFGTNYEDMPIEVANPQGYRGPWNQAEFADLCEQYYRKAVGATGTGIRIEGGVNIRMRNNTFAFPYQGEFEIPGDGPGGW
jgi:hypothetical protein